MIKHIVSECSKLAQKEFKTRNDWVGKMIHLELCKRLNFDHITKWHKQEESILENEMHKILRDFEMQMDYLIILAKRRDLGLILFTNPSARAGYDTRSIIKRSLTGFNSEFPFSSTSCLTKAEEPSLSYYLPIAGGRIIGFIPFPRVLVLCEMQSVSSQIWTCVAMSIS